MDDDLLLNAKAGWQTDPLGLRGQQAPANRSPLVFPGAQIAPDLEKGNLESVPLGDPLRGSVAPTNFALPWQFSTVVDGGNNKLTCNPYSYLFVAAMDGTTETISNLIDNYTPTAGQYAYLEIDQDNTGAITSTAFKVDGGWPEFPAFYTINSTDPTTPFVDSFYLPVAKFVAPSDPTPGYILQLGTPSAPTPIKVIPLCNQNQLEVLRQMGGLVGISTEAWSGIA